ncbi:MAG: Smr/MutS family protein [Spirochaetaceae bacterium]|jgi:DNA-nicking Smr family endonuclease|nr:Smr/MutS family protein [Spirochaetaceae bacterium]
MDFGDILDEWDRRTAHSQGKKGNQRKQKTEKKEKIEKIEKKEKNPLEIWLAGHEVYDKDADNPDEGRPPWERRRRLLRKKPDAVIDLHGLTQDEAWTALENFFEESNRQGCEKLHIIHGKGNHCIGGSVLKQVVRKYIERCPFAGESGQENAGGGGAGVTWVLLKKLYR